MSKTLFTKQLSLLSLLVAILLFALHYTPQIAPYSGISWLSLLLFILLSILMYYFGDQAAKSDNKHTFTNVVIGFMAGKMFISLMLIFLYKKLVEPETSWFVLPFFLVYLFFTIYETYFMGKLGRTQKTT